MMAKWLKKRPVKFTGDYYTLPSRFDLSGGLLGMYNPCWDFQTVANAVGMVYGDADRQFRAEMITSSLIAHRRKRMLSGFDGLSIDSIIATWVGETKPTGKEFHFAFTYDFQENKRVPAWSVGN